MGLVVAQLVLLRVLRAISQLYVGHVWWGITWLVIVVRFVLMLIHIVNHVIVLIVLYV